MTPFTLKKHKLPPSKKKASNSTYIARDLWSDFCHYRAPSFVFTYLVTYLLILVFITIRMDASRLAASGPTYSRRWWSASSEWMPQLTLRRPWRPEVTYAPAIYTPLSVAWQERFYEFRGRERIVVAIRVIQRYPQVQFLSSRDPNYCTAQRSRRAAPTDERTDTAAATGVGEASW